MPSQKSSSKKTESAPVVEKTETVPKVEAKPVQKAGAKKVEAKSTPAPKEVVEAKPVPAKAVVEAKPTKGGAKKSKVEAKSTPPAKAVVEAKPAKGGAKKEAKEAKVAKAPKVAKAETEEEEAQVSKSGKVLRSFKVQLPGQEEFSGRFTGSTPYQAANKALSKYYRTTESPKSTVTFVMRESTRGCKKNGNYPTYTYEGYRDFLPEPVSYTITDKDGKANTIVKKHKNHLKKVKKADMNASQGVSASA